MSLATKPWQLPAAIVMGFFSINLLIQAEARLPYLMKLDSAFGPILPHQSQKLLSLGQPESLGLSQWIQFSIRNELVFPGDAGKESDLGLHLNNLAKLNPFFATQYFDGAHLLILLANDGIGAQELLQASIQQYDRLSALDPNWTTTHWSHIENLWLLLGYTRIFELGDLAGAKEAFAQVSKNPRLKHWYDPLVRRLDTPVGRYEIAIRLHQELIRRYVDEEILRNNAIRNLEHTLIGFRTFELNRGKPTTQVEPAILRQILFNPDTQKYEPRQKLNLLKGLEL